MTVFQNISALDRSDWVRYCDRFAFICLNILVFAAPISTALIEWGCGLATLACLLKWFVFKEFDVTRHTALTYNSTQSSKNIFQTLLINYLDLWIWLMFCVVSIFLSEYSVNGWKGLIGKNLQNVLLMFIAVDVLTTSRRHWTLVCVFLLSYVLVSAAGIWQYIFGWDFLRLSELSHGRVSSSLRASTDLGVYLALNISILSALIVGKLNNRNASNQNEYKDLTKNIRIMLFALGLGLVCIGVSYSRGAWLVLALSLFVIGLFNKHFLKLAGAGFLVFLIFFSFRMVQEREHMHGYTLFASFGRAMYWQEATDMIKDHPIFGVGLNAYSEMGREYKVSWGGYPHNCYLQMAAEIGIPATCIFVIFLIRMLFRSWQGILRMPSHIGERYLRIGLTMALTAFLLQSALDTFFYSTQLSVLMWVLMGFVLATLVNDRKGNLTN